MSPLTPSQAVLGGEDNSVAPSRAKETRTPGPWQLVEATEHHGPYVTSEWGVDVCDLYAMSDPLALSVRNGGTSRPIPFADANGNARLIAAAPTLLEVLKEVRDGHACQPGYIRTDTLHRVARAIFEAERVEWDGSSPKDPTSRTEGVSK